MTGSTVIPATDALLAEVARTMRAEDRAEVLAFGLDPAVGLATSAASSLWVRVAVDAAGRPMAAWGLAPMSLLGGVGGPWMLSTTAISPRALLRETKRQVADMLRLSPALECWVSAEYKGAVRWMLWAGFRVDGDAELSGHLFHRFVLRA